MFRNKNVLNNNNKCSLEFLKNKKNFQKNFKKLIILLPKTTCGDFI